MAEKQTKLIDFTLGRSIGRGQFGDVFAAQDKRDKHLVAIKVLKRTKIEACNIIHQLRNEVQIQSSLQHPNILHMREMFSDIKNYYLILDFARGGDLFHELRTVKQFNEYRAAAMAGQIADALTYLHARRFIHRDIKPENIMLNRQKDTPLLSDFGWSVLHLPNEMGETLTRSTLCGTPDYLAPEMVSGMKHDHRVDTWAVGVLVYEMLYGQAPFMSTDNEITYEKIVQRNFSFPPSGMANPPLISLEAKHFIRGLLKIQPTDRMELRQVKDSPWIKKFCELHLPVKDASEYEPVEGRSSDGDVTYTVTPATPTTTSSAVVPSASKTTEAAASKSAGDIGAADIDRKTKIISSSSSVTVRSGGLNGEAISGASVTGRERGLGDEVRKVKPSATGDSVFLKPLTPKKPALKPGASSMGRDCEVKITGGADFKAGSGRPAQNVPVAACKPIVITTSHVGKTTATAAVVAGTSKSTGMASTVTMSSSGPTTVVHPSQSHMMKHTTNSSNRIASGPKTARSRSASRERVAAVASSSRVRGRSVTEQVSTANSGAINTPAPAGSAGGASSSVAPPPILPDSSARGATGSTLSLTTTTSTTLPTNTQPSTLTSTTLATNTQPSTLATNTQPSTLTSTTLATSTTSLATGITFVTTNTTSLTTTTSSLATSIISLATTTTSLAKNTTSLAASTTSLATSTTSLVTSSTSLATSTTSLVNSSTSVSTGTTSLVSTTTSSASNTTASNMSTTACSTSTTASTMSTTASNMKNTPSKMKTATSKAGATSTAREIYRSIFSRPKPSSKMELDGAAVPVPPPGGDGKPVDRRSRSRLPRTISTDTSHPQWVPAGIAKPSPLKVPRAPITGTSRYESAADKPSSRPQSADRDGRPASQERGVSAERGSRRPEHKRCLSGYAAATASSQLKMQQKFRSPTPEARSALSASNKANSSGELMRGGKKEGKGTGANVKGARKDIRGIQMGLTGPVRIRQMDRGQMHASKPVSAVKTVQKEGGKVSATVENGRAPQSQSKSGRSALTTTNPSTHAVAPRVGYSMHSKSTGSGVKVLAPHSSSDISVGASCSGVTASAPMATNAKPGASAGTAPSTSAARRQPSKVRSSARPPSVNDKENTYVASGSGGGAKYVVGSALRLRGRGVLVQSNRPRSAATVSGASEKKVEHEHVQQQQETQQTSQ